MYRFQNLNHMHSAIYTKKDFVKMRFSLGNFFFEVDNTKWYCSTITGVTKNKLSNNKSGLPNLARNQGCIMHSKQRILTENPVLKIHLEKELYNYNKMLH